MNSKINIDNVSGHGHQSNSISQQVTSSSNHYHVIHHSHPQYISHHQMPFDHGQNSFQSATPASAISIPIQQVDLNRNNSVTAALMWPIVVRPLLCKIQKHSQYAAITLLKALGKAEHREPGFLLELVTAILASRNITVNMTESLLRLQANIPEFEEQRCRRTEEPFQELNRRTFALKKILSRIPDVLYDRQVFLETIRKIASAIKKLLDCVNEISSSGFLSNYQDKRAVDNRKREFIKDSKSFSQTLKEYFKRGDERVVLQSAAQLIYATNAIQKTLKNCCDVKEHSK